MSDEGFVLPPNLVEGVFTHFSADNLDILDSSLDVKDTCHVTQITAWQAGPGKDIDLEEIVPSKNKTLEAPPDMDKIICTNAVLGKGAPTFENVDLDMFKTQPTVTKQSTAKDMAFLIERQKQDLKVGWTEYNEAISTNTKEIKTVGYMLSLQAPAHEINTLNTVVQRCLYVW